MRWEAWALAAAMCAVPSAAAGETRETLAVLPISVGGETGQATVSTIHAAVAGATAYRPTLELLSYEQVFDAAGRLGDAVLDCGSDEACMADRLRASGARLGLVAIVNELASPPLVSLILLDTAAGATVDRVSSAVDPAELDVAGAIRARAAKMFDRAGHVQHARIVVRATPADAAVRFVPAALPALTPHVYWVPAGKYRVRVSSDGHLARESELDARAGEELTISLELERERGLLESPWFWGGVAAVVVGGVVTTVVLLQDPKSCFCVDRGDGMCEAC